MTVNTANLVTVYKTLHYVEFGKILKYPDVQTETCSYFFYPPSKGRRVKGNSPESKGNFKKFVPFQIGPTHSPLKSSSGDFVKSSPEKSILRESLNVFLDTKNDIFCLSNDIFTSGPSSFSNNDIHEIGDVEFKAIEESLMEYSRWWC
jgi:hypothetical protein